ncbi:unnamed protein product [Dibothriocephalus latus]|uniref:Uncharacterized protein n=1 Tax=Dibothriocephalus latus TaxID=60516 RepID=A0A3P7NHR8_DIBLA|nr:unnamed protein product [Dibothriocephalus latus]
MARSPRGIDFVENHLHDLIREEEYLSQWLLKIQLGLKASLSQVDDTVTFHLDAKVKKRVDQVRLASENMERIASLLKADQESVSKRKLLEHLERLVSLLLCVLNSQWKAVSNLNFIII